MALILDGTAGITTPALFDSGNLTFTGTGNRITGDFSNATTANRVMFQTSTANGSTDIPVAPNGTGSVSRHIYSSSSDIANASLMNVGVVSTEASLRSAISGTGTYLPMTFYTGGSERMRIDTSGNLGLGVTPSAWGGLKSVQVGQGAAFSGGAAFNDAFISANAYYNGTNWIRIGTNAAALYAVGALGTHIWNVASSSAAGSTISFTQAMTLDASGNLGIGATSISDPLHISKTSYPIIRLEDTGKASSMYLGMHSGSSEQRITCTGAYPLVFSTNGADRMRIDSSGNLLVGTTSNYTAARLALERANADIIGLRGNNVGSGVRYDTTSGSGTFAYFTTNSNTQVAGSISVSGTSTTYATSSDYRLKENIQPMQNALARNSQLKPVTYTWRADGSSGEGFIAHELQAVCPDAVTGEKDAVDNDGNPVYQGVDTSFLVGHLVACINELKAELDELKAKVK